MDNLRRVQRERSAGADVSARIGLAECCHPAACAQIAWIGDGPIPGTTQRSGTASRCLDSRDAHGDPGQPVRPGHSRWLPDPAIRQGLHGLVWLNAGPLRRSCPCRRRPASQSPGPASPRRHRGEMITAPPHPDRPACAPRNWRPALPAGQALRARDRRPALPACEHGQDPHASPVRQARRPRPAGTSPLKVLASASPRGARRAGRPARTGPAPAAGDSAPVPWRRTRPPPRAGWPAQITRLCDAGSPCRA